MTSVSWRRRSQRELSSDHAWNGTCSHLVAVLVRCPHLLVLLAALPGCLFVGDVNERPSLGLSALSVTTTLGQPLELVGSVLDDQRGVTLLTQVRGGDGQIVHDPCVQLSQLGDRSAEAPSLVLQVWRAGTYTVEATPVDTYGAPGSSATVQVTYANAPPAFASPTTPLREAAAPASCGAFYTAGVPIPITLDAPAHDPEADAPLPPAGCDALPPPLSYHFALVAQPDGAGATLGPASAQGVCPAVRPATKTELAGDALVVCLYPDPALPSGAPSSYLVAVDVSDGTNTVPSTTLMIPVIGDAPACLDGVYPAAGHYVLARTEPQVFQALGADDVTDAIALTYEWSILRGGEITRTVVSPPTSGADGGGRLALDPAVYGFAVGEQVELRVEISDGVAASCDPALSTCEAASCAAGPGASCARAATWTLEYR